MRPLPAALLACLLLPALPAAAGEAEILAAGRAACADFENGIFSLAPDAITRTDLDGDGAADTVIEAYGFRCSTAAALYCGTGGCMIHFLVGGSVHSRLAKGWTVTDWAGDRIVLLQVHGTECGGTNLRRCYEALVWSEGAFRSLRDGR